MRIKMLLLPIALLACAACSSPNDARRALTAAGYTKIDITGYEVFGCGDDDTFSTGFVATNPAGQEVSGVVCSGWFKRGTIRF